METLRMRKRRYRRLDTICCTGDPRAYKDLRLYGTTYMHVQLAISLLVRRC